MGRFIFCLMGALLLLSEPSRAWCAPKVAVTIAPLHAAVAAVMEGVGEPELLISSTISPHGYALKPSDLRRISEAEVLVMVSGNFESFLTRPLSSLEKKPEVISMETLSSILVLKNRDGDAADEHDHEHSQIDPHLWLDAENMEALTREIASVLSRLDAPNKKTYWENANRYITELDKVDTETKKKLTGMKELRFVVFHDAFQYFENRYRIPSYGVVMPSPEQSPSPKHLEILRQRIRNEKVHCLLHEPQFSSAQVDRIVEDEKLKSIEIDPLGSKFAPGKGLYPSLLRGIAESYAACQAK